MFLDTLNPLGYLRPMNIVEDGGGGGETEFESMAIPETYKDQPIGKYKTVGELAKGYSEAQKLIGAKGVILPGENAEAEEVDKFYKALGRPDNPDGYKFDELKDLHPKLQITPEMEAGFRAFTHKHGLTQKQAAGIRQEYFSSLSQALTKSDEATERGRQEAETKLRGEWGADYETKVKRTQNMIDKFGGNGARDAFGDLGNNPTVLRVLAAIADKFSEDNFTLGGTRTEGSAADAKRKINEILSNPDHMFHKTGPGHDEAVKDMLELNKIAYPEPEETK